MPIICCRVTSAPAVAAAVSRIDRYRVGTTTPAGVRQRPSGSRVAPSAPTAAASSSGDSGSRIRNRRDRPTAAHRVPRSSGPTVASSRILRFRLGRRPPRVRSHRRWNRHLHRPGTRRNPAAPHIHPHGDHLHRPDRDRWALHDEPGAHHHIRHLPPPVPGLRPGLVQQHLIRRRLPRPHPGRRSHRLRRRARPVDDAHRSSPELLIESTHLVAVSTLAGGRP